MKFHPACAGVVMLLWIAATSVRGETLPDLKAARADNGATLAVVDRDGASEVTLDLPVSSGYPGLTVTAPEGGWDFSAYDGVQVDLTNPGTTEIVMTMRADNAGDRSKSPWSVQVFRIKPGKTETLKLRFGQSYGADGFPLDKAHVTAIKLFPNPPKAPFTVLLANLKGFKLATVSLETPLVAVEPPPPPGPPTFLPTPVIDITGKHNFPDTQALDDAATQLKGLCSLAEFNALPATDRHVYSFDPWPGEKDALDQKTYSFNFLLGTTGDTNLKVAFLPNGGGAGSKFNLARAKDPVSGKTILTGFGNLSWSGKADHVFKFNKPVLAFGVVLNSSGDMELRRFFWASANDLNGYPLSYTLADGTVIQVGRRELRGALLKAGTDSFIGVIDRSGTGIVSVSYMLKGLAGSVAQSISFSHLAVVTQPKPAFAPVINLKGSCDFASPETIAATLAPASPDLASLADFRFIAGNRRYVYRFDTWPQKNPDLGAGPGTFAFDLRGKGTVDRKVTVTAVNSANNARLTRTTLKNEESLPYPVLGGLGNLEKGAWAEQTFAFDKPVWSFGVTYRSPADAKTRSLSYTLADGTVVTPGTADGLIAADKKTFVGVIDDTDKGISSVTIRVQGTVTGVQPVFIEELAFALAGPPPGDWTLTLNENFDGDKLDPKIWTPGYTFPDVINNELQGYVPENVTVANGLCTIKIEERDCRNTDRTGRLGGAQKFASGAFTSYDKFTQTYGYFEARLKMPKARAAGLWPAFWMLPDRGRDYPAKIRSSYRTKNHGQGIEIDIFEFQPWWKRADGTFPLHVGCIWSYAPVSEKDPAPHGYGAYAKDNDGWGPAEIYFPALDTKFHTYGLYWSPERLIYYVDGKPVYRVKDPKNVPDVPEYFIFNVAITGNGWGRGPGKKNPTREQIRADMPNVMEIDYFRAYSGTLEEAIPPAPSDIPGPVNKYKAPGKDEAIEPWVAPAAAPAGSTPATGTPGAPANVNISTPSNG
ncbi:MAG TPA: glycoside hydrolase family 16 protein [Rariglobus sp.]|nr:glycoside hydrolase family 16 protein [Rariglobus sp.]